MFSLHALVIYSLLTMATTLHVCRLITWLKEQQVKALNWLTLYKWLSTWMCESFVAALIGISSQFSPSTGKRALAPLFLLTCERWSHGWPTSSIYNSPRRDTLAAWMYQGSMRLITLQSIQELAIDRYFLHSVPPYCWITVHIMLTSIRTVTVSMHIVANG